MKKETLEEAAEREASLFYEKGSLDWNKYRQVFIEGAKCKEERMYSEEDLISFAHFYFRKEFNSTMQTSKSTDEILQEWFEQNKKK